MPNRIKKHQLKAKRESTEYSAPYFKSGVVTVSVSAGEIDYGFDTGVAKFPNGIIMSNVTPYWVNGSWAYLTRGLRAPSQGGTNIVFSAHVYSNINQTISYAWWALGY